MKLFEIKASHPGFYTDRDDILSWLYVHTTAVTHNVTIHENGTVDYDGSIIVKSNSDLDYVLVNFGTVAGNFDISRSYLRSLHGCPREVSGIFDVSRTYIESLEGGPREVGGEYRATECPKLSSLRGCAKHIGQGLNIHGNSKIKSLDGLAGCVIRKYFEASECSIESLIPFPTMQDAEYVDLNRNKFTSLEGIPNPLRFSVDVSENSITTLDHLPQLTDDNVHLDLTNNDIIKSSVKDGKLSYDIPSHIELDAEGKMENITGNVYLLPT